MRISRIILSALLLWTTAQSGTAAREIFKKPYTSYKLSCADPGGTLVLATTTEPKSFNPITAQETSTTQITSFIFEGLTRTDPRTLEVMPNLAERWETRDGIDWIFHLRRDVRWNDGAPFSADDVVFTFNEIICNPTIPSSSKDIFMLDGKPLMVEKIDAYTVRFELPCVFAPFLRALSQEILPAHAYQALVLQGRFSFSLGLDAGCADIIGTGPFLLSQYLPGERVVLKKNPFYWKRDACGKQLPYLEKIIFVIIPSPDTALMKFLEGQIDYYSVRPQDLGLLGPQQTKKRFSLYNAGPGVGTHFLVLNRNDAVNPHTHKPFASPHKVRWADDVRFRKAISYAINREKIIAVVYNGLGIAQYSAESPANKAFYTDNITTYPYNPERAKALLVACGFTKRPDGTLMDPEGNELTLTFMTNADSSERVQIASLIQKDLTAIGITTNFISLDFNTLVNKLVATRDWEMMLIGLSGTIEPYFGKNVWSYTGSLHAWDLSGKAREAYEEEIEEIFRAGATTLDEEKRKALFSRFQKIVRKNSRLSIPLFLIHSMR
ncbi:MAG: ABC transporter substrate-binding protein [Candidatus Omnitrophica bacterium]|nr:ABC transporter substrate-binding protein [Candidatus Omnitrophota bacterium]